MHYIERVNTVRRFVFVVALALLTLAIFEIWRELPLKDWSMAVSDYSDRLGTKGIVAYGLIYIIATLLLVPCAFLTFAAGMAYGFWGLPIVLFSAMIGSSLAFFISRHFVKNRVDEYMARRPQTQALKKAIENEGWKFMLLMRVSPFLPFNLNNYFLGTVQVGFPTYFWVTILGLLPGTTIYVFLGTLGRDLDEARGIKMGLLVLGFAATMLLVRITMRKTREILRRGIDKSKIGDDVKHLS